MIKLAVMLLHIEDEYAGKRSITIWENKLMININYCQE